MTSAALPPTPPQATELNATPAAAQPPRKRRRRTAGGGATDDCFTCRSRAAKCDRKRPYCTQCIEIGKECSGYKTTLTWGVGVASRGKLRGLSCPIANKNVDGSDMSPEEQAEVNVKRRRKSSVAKIKKEEDGVANVVTSAVAIEPSPAATSPVSAPSVDHLYPPSSGPADSSINWRMPGFQSHLRARESQGGRNLQMPHPGLPSLQTALGPQYDNLNMPHSSRSVGSYAETEFYSPMEYPHTPNTVVFAEQMPRQTLDTFLGQSMSSGSERFPSNGMPIQSFLNSVSSKIESIPDMPALPDSGTMDPNSLGLDQLPAIQSSIDNAMSGLLSDGPLSFGVNLPDFEEEVEDGSKALSLLDNRFSSPFFHISPRLQSLMEHYNRNICPYIVAFDGPENPYRKHILQLSIGNTGLQNAIAALSTNNLRMRKKQPRQLGFVEEVTDAFDGSTLMNLNEPTPEESCYKQMSIDYLNMQLADVRSAQDDAVLATLLILCLFHVCDSGFSKFKTQLAGVQKLLSLRDASNQSEFTRWVQMFFTWFDVMTSTVNDRETQIKGDSMSMSDFSANLGPLEQFSGCDGRLFKLIARLGRLNVLAQGKPVSSKSSGQQSPRPVAVQKPSARLLKRKRPTIRFSALKSLSAADYENIDGNGWGTPIISSDEDADGSDDEDVKMSEERSDFWTEWKEIRGRLQSWRMDHSTTTSDLPRDPVQLEAGQRDLIHINESFRYAALLYTERLGHPLLPSSHAQFQSLVAEALNHITALPVESCVTKFLLWPLFITGTECVDDNHRSFIRSRCRSIQEESGFFNNISSLELLEKVWREVGSKVHRTEAEEVKARRRDSEASRSGRYGQAFRWRKVMDRVDGEYIVV